MYSRSFIVNKPLIFSSVYTALDTSLLFVKSFYSEHNNFWVIRHNKIAICHLVPRISLSVFVKLIYFYLGAFVKNSICMHSYIIHMHTYLPAYINTTYIICAYTGLHKSNFSRVRLTYVSNFVVVRCLYAA